MRKLAFILLAVLLAFAPVELWAAETEDVAVESASEEQALDMKEYIFEHIGDSYEWHITTINGKDITIPLLCIVIDDGVHAFSSKHIAENGYALNEDGKLINAQTGKRPVDISITKNVLGLMINSLILVLIILLTARWYRKHDVLKERPRGIAALLEPAVMFVESDLIKDVIGADYKRYSPYLLTVFFFILVNNIMGIIPIFPGGANVTGNIAVTLVLAIFTFLMVNLFGNKHYYKDIFWPDVPKFLNIFPIMPLIEIVSVFTKPFALMIRLFANILAGHIMILSVIGVIFLTVHLGPVLNGAMTFVSVLFGLFLDLLEVLVAFIQAYVFTMLSAVFISLAHQQPEHETN